MSAVDMKKTGTSGSQAGRGRPSDYAFDDTTNESPDWDPLLKFRQELCLQNLPPFQWLTNGKLTPIADPVLANNEAAENYEYWFALQTDINGDLMSSNLQYYTVSGTHDEQEVLLGHLHWLPIFDQKLAIIVTPDFVKHKVLDSRLEIPAMEWVLSVSALPELGKPESEPAAQSIIAHCMAVLTNDAIPSVDLLQLLALLSLVTVRNQSDTLYSAVQEHPLLQNMHRAAAEWDDQALMRASTFWCEVIACGVLQQHIDAAAVSDQNLQAASTLTQLICCPLGPDTELASRLYGATGLALISTKWVDPSGAGSIKNMVLKLSEYSFCKLFRVLATAASIPSLASAAQLQASLASLCPAFEEGQGWDQAYTPAIGSEQNEPQHIEASTSSHPHSSYPGSQFSSRPSSRSTSRPNSRPGSRPTSRPNSRLSSRSSSRPSSLSGSQPTSRPGSARPVSPIGSISAAPTASVHSGAATSPTQGATASMAALSLASQGLPGAELAEAPAPLTAVKEEDAQQPLSPSPSKQMYPQDDVEAINATAATYSKAELAAHMASLRQSMSTEDHNRGWEYALALDDPSWAATHTSAGLAEPELNDDPELDEEHNDSKSAPDSAGVEARPFPDAARYHVLEQSGSSKEAEALHASDSDSDQRRTDSPPQHTATHDQTDITFGSHIGLGGGRQYHSTIPVEHYFSEQHNYADAANPGVGNSAYQQYHSPQPPRVDPSTQYAVKSALAGMDYATKQLYIQYGGNSQFESDSTVFNAACNSIDASADMISDLMTAMLQNQRLDEVEMFYHEDTVQTFALTLQNDRRDHRQWAEKLQVNLPEALELFQAASVVKTDAVAASVRQSVAAFCSAAAAPPRYSRQASRQGASQQTQPSGVTAANTTQPQESRRARQAQMEMDYDDFNDDDYRT